jgi:hypothetical protein
MTETDNKKRQRPKILKLTIISVGVIGFIIILALFLSRHFAILYPYPHPPEIECPVNINILGKAIFIYTHEENNGKYPAKDKWCDLLMEGYYDEIKECFRCPGNKEERCSYAMNQNCEPNSPPDVVLLFETKGGWNQFGGPELLTFENHKGKGCSIFFNDGSVKFITPEEVDDLKWTDEQKQ